MNFGGTGLDATAYRGVGGNNWQVTVTKSVAGYPVSPCTTAATIDTPVTLTLACPSSSGGPFRLTQIWRCCPFGTTDKTRYTTATVGGIAAFSQTATNPANCDPAGTYTFSDPAAPFASVTITPGNDPPAYLFFTVRGCFTNQLIAGATVFCDQTGEVSTTDAQGKARIGIPSAGTYTGTVTKARFAVGAWSYPITCGGSSQTIDLLAADGYHCFCDCPEPIPSTLELIDPVHGPITLVYTPSIGTWTAARLVGPVLGRDKDAPPGQDPSLACSVDAQVQVPIVYQLACDSGTNPRLNVFFAECQKIFPNPEPPTLTNAPADVDFNGWPLSPSGASTAATSHTCFPLNFSIPMTFANNGQILYPGGPHTFTVQELPE